MYDAIVVGARCAGATTAMLLARKGYRILLVDRATFPSEIVNGYYVQQPGIARLKQWGLLDRLRASGCPALTTLKFDFGDFALVGSPPAFNGTTEAFAPRRSVLDKILVDAAVEAGVELREGFTVQSLLQDGERVTGIRGTTRSGPAIERGHIVIGADGVHSRVAREVRATVYDARPALTCWYATHWADVPAEGLEVYIRPHQTFLVCPTNNGLTVVIVVWPHTRFREFRSDTAGNYFASLEAVPDLAARVRSGRREERFLGTADTANFFRTPVGPGWALAGDAGCHKDPSAAQGIADAFRDADLLSDAVDAGLSGGRRTDEALLGYARERDASVKDMYEFTLRVANLDDPPAPELVQLMVALHGNQADTDRFFGVFAGTLPSQEFFAADNLLRILGGAVQS